MVRLGRSGAAAAMLPAALAGAALVAAPFAGTTTSPLASSTTRAQVHATSAQPADPGLGLTLPTRSLVALGTAELVLVGVGAGVIVVTRRRHRAEVGA